MITNKFANAKIIKEPIKITKEEPNKVIAPLISVIDSFSNIVEIEANKRYIIGDKQKNKLLNDLEFILGKDELNKLNVDFLSNRNAVYVYYTEKNMNKGFMFEFSSINVCLTDIRQFDIDKKVYEAKCMQDDRYQKLLGNKLEMQKNPNTMEITDEEFTQFKLGFVNVINYYKEQITMKDLANNLDVNARDSKSNAKLEYICATNKGVSDRELSLTVNKLVKNGIDFNDIDLEGNGITFHNIKNEKVRLDVYEYQNKTIYDYNGFIYSSISDFISDNKFNQPEKETYDVSLSLSGTKIINTRYNTEQLGEEIKDYIQTRNLEDFKKQTKIQIEKSKLRPKSKETVKCM